MIICVCYLHKAPPFFAELLVKMLVPLNGPPPDYIHLEGDNGEGLPPAKRPRYFETHNEPNTSTYCAYAALDTSTAEEDDEDPEDGADPESYYTSTPADGLAQEVKAFIGATFRRRFPK